MLNSTDNGACRMTDDLVNKLHELDCRISSNFPLEAKMLEYYRRLKDENVVETSQEYVNMAYDISSMYFNDALVLLPIVLHVEISRMIASCFGGCAECVVFWICDLSRQDMQNLTLAQLVVIRDWIELVAANGFADEGIIKDAVDAIGIAINARIKNGEHYPTGEEIHVGDVIEMEWPGGRRRGRVVKLLHSPIDPNEYNWDLPDGGLLLEMDGMGLFAVDYDYVEYELHFVSRGCAKMIETDEGDFMP